MHITTTTAAAAAATPTHTAAATPTVTDQFRKPGSLSFHFEWYVLMTDWEPGFLNWSVTVVVAAAEGGVVAAAATAAAHNFHKLFKRRAFTTHDTYRNRAEA